MVDEDRGKIEPKKSYSRQSLTPDQFTELLSSDSASLPDLLQVMPAVEILDSKTLQRLKQIAYRTSSSDFQQAASDCLVKLFSVCSSQAEFLADYLDHYIGLVKETEKPVL